MSKEHAPERSKISGSKSRSKWARDDLDEAAEPLRPLPHQLYRFADLVKRNILTNRAQLKR